MRSYRLERQGFWALALGILLILSGRAGAACSPPSRGGCVCGVGELTTTTVNGDLVVTGKVGIETSTPAYPLTVSGEGLFTRHVAFGNDATVDQNDPILSGNGPSVVTIHEHVTSTTGTFQGLLSTLGVDPSDDVPGGTGYMSVVGYASTLPGNSKSIHDMSGGYFGVYHNGTGPITMDFVGLGSDVENLGGGSINRMSGLAPYMDNADGAVTIEMGQGISQHNEGTVTDLVGDYPFFEFSNSGTITNSYGVKIDSPTHGEYTSNSNSGTITNNWGIKIADETAGESTNWAIQTGLGRVEFGDVLQVDRSAFSGLPSCNSANEGSQRPVTNSATSTWGESITGGGSNHVLAYCDGTNWTVMAK